MRPYFTRERFGRPQFLAGSAPTGFSGPGLWLIHRELRASLKEMDAARRLRIREGLEAVEGQRHRRGTASECHGGGMSARDPSERLPAVLTLNVRR